MHLLLFYFYQFSTRVNPYFKGILMPKYFFMLLFCQSQLNVIWISSLCVLVSMILPQRFLACIQILRSCPASPETRRPTRCRFPRRVDSAGPVSPTCTDLKGRKLATRRNPRWLANPNSGLTQYECGRMKPFVSLLHSSFLSKEAAPATRR